MSSIAIKRAAPANQMTATGVFSFVSNNALACTVTAPGKSILESKRFRVRAEGNCLMAVGTTTLKPQILAGLTLPASPLVIANWTAALTAGVAVACPTTGCPWWAECDLIFDSVSGLMHGTFNQVVNNSFTASAAISGVLTGINSTNAPVVQSGTTVGVSDPVVYFALGMTFSAAGANICNLTNFELGY